MATVKRSPSPPPAQPAGASGASVAQLSGELQRYHAWRERIAQAIAEFRLWAEQQGLADPEQDRQLAAILDRLKNDKIHVVLVSEFSRGKSELINALFFSNSPQRLLPSAAGRTTMCTTELRYDEHEPIAVRLLPIETRRTNLTIADYRRTPVHWTTLHLVKRDTADELREALREITRTKKVHVREAEELGLYRPDRTDGGTGGRSEPNLVEIPVWRHAIVNFPHPLLHQGLVVLDTPGLNAVGTEPEITHQMIPDADSALFVLAADAGVTHSDLDIWHRHIAGPSGVAPAGRYVVLNKIDILWDELRNAADIERTVAAQVGQTAEMLGIDPSRVFPVSGQKGYAARTRKDRALFDRSGLPALESAIAREIVPSKFEMMRSRAVYDFSGRLRRARDVYEQRAAGIRQRLHELQSLGGRNSEAVHKLFHRLGADRQRYDTQIKGFELARQALAKRGATLLAPLRIDDIDALMERARNDMEQSWTTQGLRAAMGTLFAEIGERIQRVAEQAERISKEAGLLYETLQRDHHFAKRQPPSLSLVHQVIGFRQLRARADAFRTSPLMVVTEQRFVIRKFYATLAMETRRLLADCNQTATTWLKTVLAPAIDQITEHRAQIEGQLALLNKIRTNVDLLDSQMAELRASGEEAERQVQFLDSLLARVDIKA